MNSNMPMDMNMMPMQGMPSGFDNMMYFPKRECQCSNEVRSINGRIDALERDIRRINRKVEILEEYHNKMPYGSSNSNKDYPQYQNGNYMI